MKKDSNYEITESESGILFSYLYNAGYLTLSENRFCDG